MVTKEDLARVARLGTVAYAHISQADADAILRVLAAAERYAQANEILTRRRAGAGRKTLHTAFRLMDEVEQLRRELVEWKAKAEEAERKLVDTERAVRKVLGEAGPKYQREFGPEFAIPEEIVALGLPDTSWHNDSCPSFQISPMLRLWVDAVEAEKRENPNGFRFTVTHETDADGFIGEVLTTDDVAEVVGFVKFSKSREEETA